MLAGANDGELESNWHSHGFSRWPVPHFLSFFLLNMLQLLPLSIGVRVCVCASALFAV